MARKPKKVAVIGLDCALPHLIQKHIEEGHLPNFKNLIDKGVLADNCLVPFPTVTPPNWASIATGAWPGTHGITDFHAHEPGTHLGNKHTVQAFSSDRCKAETIWDALDKAGKHCIVLNYPGSWPSKMKNGILVGGSGLTVGEKREGLFGLDAEQSLCSEQLVTTGVYPFARRDKLEDANGWTNVPEMGDEPLDVQFGLDFRNAREKPAQTTWYLLVRNTEGQGYDRLTLSPSKDFNESFCTLKVNDWSPKLVTKIRMADGNECEVFFRCKLLELSEDGEDLRFYISGLCETSGWSSPAEVAEEIVSQEGIFAPTGGLLNYSLGWFDLDTYVEINELHDAWLGDAAVRLLDKHEWDLFFMHSHPIDWVYHGLLSDMDPDLCTDQEKRAQAWDAHLAIYESQDRMVGRILEVLDKDTLVILVSDHGATPDGPVFNPYKALVPAGLSKLGKTDEDTTGIEKKILRKMGFAFEPDTENSKAIPQREIYVYVNLKGRDPDGIVEPKDYEKVQQEIIDALLEYRDPETGKRPVAMALSKQDARILGLHGDKIGDVVYAVNPWFGSQHGQILPTGEWGIGSLKGLLVLNGPGIKKGQRLERTIWLTDIVPTICYLLDLPIPEHAEGAIIYQAFKNPDFKLKEIDKLRSALARMETALARQNREPWDHHDCA